MIKKALTGLAMLASVACAGPKVSISAPPGGRCGNLSVEDGKKTYSKSVCRDITFEILTTGEGLIYMTVCEPVKDKPQEPWNCSAAVYSTPRETHQSRTTQ
jgi:hypothetical protein